MRRTKGRNANMRFLFGSVFFFLIIIITIGLFAYFSLYKFWNKTPAKRFSYEISFSPSFEGKEYMVYMNDSLLYNGAPVAADTVLRLNRFAEENALLVVEKKSDVVTILQVPPRGKILLQFKGGAVSAKVD